MYGPDDYEDEEIPLPPESPAEEYETNGEDYWYEGPDPEPSDGLEDGGYDHMIVNYPEGFREP